MAVEGLVGNLLEKIAKDRTLPVDIRGTAEEIADIYHTEYRTLILSVLVPVIMRLRRRVSEGKIGYFVSEEFMTGVTRAVTERCDVLAGEGKINPSSVEEVPSRIIPFLSAIQCKAKQYQRGENYDFEGILASIAAIQRQLQSST